MIPVDAIDAWGATRRWPSRLAIEHDLLLARLIVAIYTHPTLGSELAFWGGTCLHKVHLPAPGRCSQDLDFIRHSDVDVGLLMAGIGEVAATIGLSGLPLQWRLRPGSEGAMHIGEDIRLTLRARAEGIPDKQVRIRIEVHTHESPPARPLVRLPFQVDSSWFSGSAEVLTYAPAEMVTTKLRGLCMRAKGRDLFDLWLALRDMDVDPGDVIACFGPWRPEGCTAAKAIADLDAKLADQAFRTDLESFVEQWPDGYDIDAAGALVSQHLLRRI